MKILLVIPKYNLTNRTNFDYYFPFGLGYISSVVKQAGYEVDCLNLNHFNGTTGDLINKSLNSKKYDMVCSGHLGIGYTAIEKIINAAHKHESRPKVIIGGALITSEPELIFESLKPDFAVMGEGEKTIIELLKCLENNKDLAKVNGIIYRDNGKTIFTNPREAIEDIDSLSWPDFKGLGFEEQLENMSNFRSPYGLFDKFRVYPVLASRGCPFRCTFCYHCLGFKYRTRSIDNIMEELTMAVKNYKINMIFIYDDLFSADKERLYEFCQKIKNLINELPWECKWRCQLSVPHIDRELLRTVKDAGCYGISFGFESYSSKVLKSMKKPITPQQIDNTIKLLFEERMVIQGLFIFGDAAETNETAKETLDYWKKNCKGQVALYFIQPYPGSEIYKHCLKKGIIKDELYFIKNKMGHTNWLNMTDEMTDKEVLGLKKEILSAKRKYNKYILPLKIKKEDKINRYALLIKCPFCHEINNYKNCHIPNRFHYMYQAFCKACCMTFYIVSPLYKLGVRYYQELDFIRRGYLLIRDNILKKRM